MFDGNLAQSKVKSRAPVNYEKINSALFAYRHVAVREVSPAGQRLQSSPAPGAHAVHAATAPRRRPFGPAVARHAPQPGEARWIRHQEPRHAHYGSHSKVSLLFHTCVLFFILELKSDIFLKRRCIK